MLCKKAGNRFSGLIGAVAHPVCPQDALDCGARFWLERPSPRLRPEQGRRRIELRRRVKVLTVEAEQRSKIGITDASGVFENCAKYRFQIAGRL
jgi:hypothetical protein